MHPAVAWLSPYSGDVGQQWQERIAQEIVSVRPDPRVMRPSVLRPLLARHEEPVPDQVPPSGQQN
jgi:hypothetical protein